MILSKISPKVGIFALFLLVFNAQSLCAQEADQKTRILFVFDASNSMNAEWESSSKMDVATQLLAEAMDGLEGIPNLELALRVYGHQTYIRPGQQDCNDTKLEVPFSKYSHGDIKETVLRLIPKGTTPIARSLEKSADDFPDCPDCRNIIILITDGIEACDEDPCAVSRALQKKGVILRPFVIGIGLDPEFIKTFECVGNYFDASSEESFKNVLNVVISQALNNTTAQINLLDANGSPRESNVPITFYDSKTGALKYSFVHTLNRKGKPDTLALDPVLNYDIEVHTIPKLVKKNVLIKAGTHNTISFNAPQGNLDLKVTDDKNMYKNLPCVIRKSGGRNILNVQNFKTTERYITGSYDLEILSLPRIKKAGVKIRANQNYQIEIPSPGTVNVVMSTVGHGSIFVVKGNKLEWVTNIQEDATQEQFMLQPGKYKFIYRSKNSKETIYTIEREFKVRSGSLETLKI